MSFVYVSCVLHRSLKRDLGDYEITFFKWTINGKTLNEGQACNVL